MSRAASVLIFLGLSLSAWTIAAAQPPTGPASPPPSLSKEERAAAAAVQAPVLPLTVNPEPAPGKFSPPPLPGQLTAEPVSSLSSSGAPGPISQKPEVPPANSGSGALQNLPPLPKDRSAERSSSDLSGLKPVPTTPLSKNSKPVSSRSSSGQFIVHGEDLALRSAFSRRCDDISDSLRKLLRDQQPWVLPIVVLLKTGEGAKDAGKPVSYAISQIPNGGFHLQVNVNVRGDLRPADLRADVIRVLLAERILRNQTDLSSKRPRLLPDWVFTGVLEAMDYRQRARPSALFAAIFKSGKIYSIEEIIEASPVEMDALSKTIYQTSCCALVMALLDQPEGGMRLGKFLNTLAADARPERDLLNQWFPNFATTPASLNKWWSLQLASLASPSVAEPLSPAETLKQLEAAVTLRYKAKSSEIPTPRHVVATVSHAASESVEKPAAPTPDVADESVKKTSFLNRLNPFGKKAPTDEQVIATAMKEAALAEAKASETPSELPAAISPEKAKPTVKIADAPPETKPATEEDLAKPDKKPFMGWLFGSGDKKKPEKEGGEETKVIEDKKSADDKAPKIAAEKAVADEKAMLAAEKKAAHDIQTAAAEKKATDEKARVATEKKAAEEKAKLVAKDKASEKKLTAEKKATEKAARLASEKQVAEEKAKLADQKAANKTEPSVEGETEKKSGSRNPLRWFRGSKKEKAAKEDEGKEAPAEKKSAQNSMSDAAAQMIWAWSPLAGDSLVYMQAQSVAATPAASSRQVEGFLGLKFGKKKGPEGEEVPKEEGGKKSEKKEEKKPESKGEKKKDEPKESLPAEKKEEDTPEPAKVPESKHEPIKIKPLFGSSKKDKDKDEEEAPTPAEPSKKEPPPALVTEKEKPQPKRASNRASEATSKSTKKAPENEPLIEAAVSIEDYAAILKRKDRNDILKRSSNSLVSLQSRSSVLFRPIIGEYNEILISLMEGKTKGVDERLRNLRTRSAEALKKSKAVRDFIDVYEANESPSFSGLFDDYLKLPETISKELPERSNAISKYLDALDKEFSPR